MSYTRRMPAKSKVGRFFQGLLGWLRTIGAIVGGSIAVLIGFVVTIAVAIGLRLAGLAFIIGLIYVAVRWIVIPILIAFGVPFPDSLPFGLL